MVGPYDEREPILPADELERRYVVRETRVRLHQARFRARVIPAYANQCTICRLKETRLLDAAHIAADAEPVGEPRISNGLSLCSIHHRAFDEDLVGISPDYQVRVHPRLLDDDDGPMLALLTTRTKQGSSSRGTAPPDRTVSCSPSGSSGSQPRSSRLARAAAVGPPASRADRAAQ
jgi:hypothetical protein